MTNFQDLGIKPKTKTFDGDKIKIERILNRQIEVHRFIIEKSKFESGNGQRIRLQLVVDNEKRILFTNSVNLMEMIQKVPADKFPFRTTIIRENQRFEFT